MTTPDISNMNDGNYFSETKEEIEAKKGKVDPLEPDLYIAKVAKIELGMYDTWDDTKKKYTSEHQELGYKLVLLPYKLMNEDTPMRTTKGQAVEPLTPWIWRGMNPFAVGLTKDSEPTFLRGFTAAVQGASPSLDTPPPVKDIVVLDDKQNIVTGEKANQYKINFIKVQKSELTRDEFLKMFPGWGHIWDVRMFEGNYIGIRVALDTNNRNKVTNFNKIPSSFKPDPAIESEKMAKFEESYKKLLAKWAGESEVEESSSVEQVTASLEGGEVQANSSDEDTMAGKKVGF